MLNRINQVRQEFLKPFRCGKTLPNQLRLKNTLTASLPRAKTPTHECPRYNTKLSDGEVQVMLELWGMQSTPSLPSHPGRLWLEVVAPDRVLSIGQIEPNYILMQN